MTPLYLRIADRTGTDRLSLAAIPVLQASLASSPLPVSNLTNLIVEGSRGVGGGAFLVELGPATAVMVGVGWLGYRPWAEGRHVAGGSAAEQRAGEGPGGWVPVLVLWASLAALLWVQACRGLGLAVTAADYHRVGWRVGAPALVAAVLTRMAQVALT